MPDSQRELRMRHTSEGAEKVRADLDKITKGEEEVKDQTDDLGKSSEDLGIKKENLTNILRNIHPALGGLADGLINATELSGRLGSANIDLGRIMEVGRGLVLKYKDALMLLGAGGAAFLAITALIKAWKDLTEAEKEAIQSAKEFQETQSEIAENSERIREQIGRALIEKTGGAVSDEEITQTVAEYLQYARQLKDPDRAMRIAMQEEPPPTPEEMETQRRLIGGTWADRMREISRQAMQATPTGAIMPDSPKAMYTGDTRRLHEYVAENVPEGIADEVLTEMAETLLEWQGEIKKSLDRYRGGQQVPREARRMLLELGITQEDFQPGGYLGHPRPQGASDREQRETSETLKQGASDRDQRETSEALKQAAILQRESAQALDEATRRLVSAAEHFDSATERANQNRLRHGTTPRREAIAMREG